MAGSQAPDGVPRAGVESKVRRWRSWDDQEDEGAGDVFKPLSRDEAQAWRTRHAQPLVRRVLLAQALLWLLAVVLAVVLQWLVWPARGSLAASVAWGGACAWLPSLVMAWGMAGGLRARWRARPGVPAADGRRTLARWLAWEGVKVVLALAMLVAAPRVVQDLDWLGLVAGLVVVLKGYALAWWPVRAR